VTTRKVRRLNREIIATGVVEVGFDALTITSLAEHLGVVHASLYRHVANRDELVALGVDRLLTQTAWHDEDDADWRAYLEGQAWTLWELLEAHPGLSTEMAVLESPPSALKARQAQVAAQLESLGFAPEDAALAVDTVYDLPFDVFIRSSVINQARAQQDPGRDWFARKLDLVLAGIEVRLAPG
jgi:AcrR family transcriptional regulator